MCTFSYEECISTYWQLSRPVPETPKTRSSTSILPPHETPLFTIDAKNKSYKHQYANIYFVRLRQLRESVEEQAKKKWNEVAGMFGPQLSLGLTIDISSQLFLNRKPHFCPPCTRCGKGSAVFRRRDRLYGYAFETQCSWWYCPRCKWMCFEYVLINPNKSTS